MAAAAVSLSSFPSLRPFTGSQQAISSLLAQQTSILRNKNVRAYCVVVVRQNCLGIVLSSSSSPVSVLRLTLPLAHGPHRFLRRLLDTKVAAAFSLTKNQCTPPSPPCGFFVASRRYGRAEMIPCLASYTAGVDHPGTRQATLTCRLAEGPSARVSSIAVKATKSFKRLPTCLLKTF